MIIYLEIGMEIAIFTKNRERCREEFTRIYFSTTYRIYVIYTLTEN